jgi:hypothetical protein
MAPESTQKRQPVGGAAFFASYLVLIFLSVANMHVLLTLSSDTPLDRVLLLSAGLILGWWVAYTFFRGQLSVLLHEYKHAILALLVGNKWKRLRLKGMGGDFTYTYTKDTAEYNAFISVAPYFLPLLTFVGGLFFLTIYQRSLEGAVVLFATLHGAELYFNFKDATPIQTDLTDIRGGFLVGIGYVIVANLFITSTVIIGVLGGNNGFKLMANALWTLGTWTVTFVRAVVIPQTTG